MLSAWPTRSVGLYNSDALYSLLVGESDEHSVCEPVQPTYLRWPQLRETRLVELLFLEDVTAVLAMNPLSRAVPTDFLSVRVYLRSETTRSMGLGYDTLVAVAYSAPVVAVFIVYPIGQGSFSDGMPLGISGTSWFVRLRLSYTLATQLAFNALLEAFGVMLPTRRTDVALQGYWWLRATVLASSRGSDSTSYWRSLGQAGSRYGLHTTGCVQYYGSAHGYFVSIGYVLTYSLSTKP